jgi:DNA-binding SARP family transcriptional activator/tetratricopeptide (TPR) repeat protein
VGTAHVRLLGAVRFVTDRGEAVDLPSAAQRRLLAALALASGTTQRTEHLSDSLGLSTGSLRTTVSRLRSRIGDDVIRTDSAGYRITCGVDATMFTDLLVERPDDRDRLAVLEEALALWDGEGLDEFRHETWAAPEVARLDELRALAVEDRAQLLITRSRAGEAVASLEAHVAANPLRDRPRGLLMAALASDGRQADALRAYQAYRSFLGEEIGTEPSPLVRSIERRITAGWGDGDDRSDGAEVAAWSAGGPEGIAVVELPLHSELLEAPVLIGRLRELSWLASDLVAARSGSMRVAMLGGEAGIGKTTLVAAFARAQHLQGGNVVAYGRCAEGAAVPLEPFRSIVADLVEHAPLALLRAHCERCGGELQRVAPRLGDRLWVPPPRPSDDATERHQLFEAIADLLRRVAVNGSLTLILDDVHWAEPTALLLLRHLGRSLVDASVLVLACYRDTSVEATDDVWSALVNLDPGRCRWISLTGFDDAEMTRLIGSITRREVAGGDVLRQIHGETAGNPLYAAQLVRHLWESELLAIEDGEIRLIDRKLGDDIPRSLVEVVWSRVRALGDDAAVVLRAASVLGVDFDEDVLVPVTELTGAEVDASLDGAMGAGLLVETGDAPRRLRFTHALVAHALYSRLSPRQRRRLHGRAVQVLRRIDEVPRPDTVVELARHSALAGDLTAAQRWAVAAADHAFGHVAPSEAAAWCERALAYADGRQVPAVERAALVLRLGEARRREGDPRASRTLLDAARLAEEAGATDVLIRAALANDRGFTPAGGVDREQLAALEAAIADVDPSDEATYARLLACHAQELVSTTRQDERFSAAHKAIELSEGSDDPTLLPRMISALVFALWGHDTLDLQRRLATQAVDLAATVADPALEFSAHRARYYVAVVSADAGSAQASLRRMRDIAAEIGEPRMAWNVAVFEAFEAVMTARLIDGEQTAERALGIGTEIGEPVAFMLYAGQLFMNRSFAGRYAEVVPLLEQAMSTDPDSFPFRLAHAISCAVAGRTAEARAVLDEGAAAGFADLPRDHLWMTSVVGYAVLAIELADRGAAAQLYPMLQPFGDQVAFNGATSQGDIGAYLGKLASLLGRHDAADAHLRRALEVNVTFGWRYHEATTLVALALSQRRRTGTLDGQGRDWLDRAAAIGVECGLAMVATQVERTRRGDALL